jgi:hypothetical protein
MASSEQVIKALKNRVAGLKEAAKQKRRYGLIQQVEELEALVELLERARVNESHGRKTGDIDEGSGEGRERES